MKPIFCSLLALLTFDIPALDALPSPKSAIHSVEETSAAVEELTDASELFSNSRRSAAYGHGRKLELCDAQSSSTSPTEPSTGTVPAYTGTPPPSGGLGTLHEWTPGMYLEVGQLFVYNDEIYRVQQTHTATEPYYPNVNGVVSALYALQPFDGFWKPGAWYYRGYAVIDDDCNRYRCIHSHQSQVDWVPGGTPTLWVMDNSISDLELASRGDTAIIVDSADAVLDALNQIVAQLGADPSTDPDLTQFEKELYDVVPDLQAFICFLNGRVPLDATAGEALKNKIMANPAIQALATLVDEEVTTAGEIRNLLETNPSLKELAVANEFLDEIEGLADDDVVTGWWANGILPTIPGTTPTGNRRLGGRMLGFWDVVAGIALGVAGVASVVIGVVQAVACGPCGIPAIVGGASAIVGSLESFGVDVPFLDGGGLQVTCTSNCNISPTGLRLAGVD
eukprot:CAMPEP_0113563158 /NCGR_PEP_ID=MMETSP0015_2-20120614/20913_1 /TAXON_ID=2838 /ORGANISM="Odontella" /LENGTH=450 /DNA_ID=CAMNT_0000465107 /DNA_START=19 /DNA_END=1371 /DNA_ORIENTATION=- /assembly_acc=CAM_ASM_000160